MFAHVLPPIVLKSPQNIREALPDAFLRYHHF
jgi:hypothetical protein